jgi:hypothetical protein
MGQTLDGQHKKAILVLRPRRMNLGMLAAE